MPPFVLPLAGLITAGIGLNELKKAGQNRAIIEMFKDGRLGSPTGGFGYQTGFGPGMLLPTSGYQSILNYNQKMSDQQRKALVENLLAVEPITDRAKKRDFERNMAAARFRTQLGTQQGLTLQGQRGAQALAQDAQRAAGTALASNYQYQ